MITVMTFQNRGILGNDLLPECSCKENPLSSCKLKLLDLAERMDCSIPSCQVWLDNVCPTKQVRPSHFESSSLQQYNYSNVVQAVQNFGAAIVVCYVLEHAMKFKYAQTVQLWTVQTVTVVGTVVTVH